MKNNNPHPIDFICIGAQKAGTSWLYARLNELNQFDLPYKKEIHYFDRDKTYPSPSFLAGATFIKKLTNYAWVKEAVSDFTDAIAPPVDFNELRWLTSFYISKYDDNWYTSIFDQFSGITGEITPSYSILNEKDVKHMHQLLPHIKIIFLLRNPIYRAWSHYRFNFLNNKKRKFHHSDLDMKEIIAFMGTERQELRSNYLRTLEIYTRYYNQNQMLIGFYDAIEHKPTELLKGIVDFLDADDPEVDINCNVHNKENVSIKIKIPIPVEDYLTNKYTPMLKELSDLFGGYCTHWYRESEMSHTTDDTANRSKPSYIIL